MGVDLGSLFGTAGIYQRGVNEWKIRALEEQRQQQNLMHEFAIQQQQADAAAAEKRARGEYEAGKNQTAEDVAKERADATRHSADQRLVAALEAAHARRDIAQASDANKMALGKLNALSRETVAGINARSREKVAGMKASTGGQKATVINARLKELSQRAREVASAYPTAEALQQAEKENPELTAELNAPFALDPEHPEIHMTLRGELGSAWAGEADKTLGVEGRMYGAVPNPAKVTADLATLKNPAATAMTPPDTTGGDKTPSGKKYSDLKTDPGTVMPHTQGASMPALPPAGIKPVPGVVGLNLQPAGAATPAGTPQAAGGLGADMKASIMKMYPGLTPDDIDAFHGGGSGTPGTQ